MSMGVIILICAVKHTLALAHQCNLLALLRIFPNFPARSWQPSICDWARALAAISCHCGCKYYVGTIALLSWCEFNLWACHA